MDDTPITTSIVETIDHNNPIMPEVIQVCPSQRDIPLTELGIENEALVVDIYDKMTGEKLDPSETGAMILTFDYSMPQSIPDTSSKDGLYLARYYPASDHQSIELVYEDPGKQHREVWRSSIDGLRQWKVEDYRLEPLPENQYRLELGNGKYLVYEKNYADPSDSIYSKPISINDRNTGTIRLIPTFPEKSILLNSFIIEGKPYLIYIEERRVDLYESPNYDFLLYNLDKLSSLPILQWLSGEDGIDWLTTHLFYKDNEHFDLLVARSYGLDLGINLDMDAILTPHKYDEVMQVIHLPDGEYSVNLFLGGFLNSRPGIILLPNPVSGEPVPFYFLDIHEMILRDYCYSVENPISTNIYARPNISVSERYVLFTRAKMGSDVNPGGQFIKSVEILDLKTGRIAGFPDASFGVIGWVMR